MSDPAEILAAGVAHHQAGKLQEAEAAYRQVLALEPNHAQAWYFFGGLAYQLGKAELAGQCIGRAAELSPDYLFDFGMLLLEQAKFDAAAACLQRLLALRPGLMEAQIRLGSIFEAQNKFAEAAECYRTVIESEPGACDAFNRLGLLLQRQGQFEDALIYHRKALALRPEYPETHFHIGNALRRSGTQVPAIASLRRAIELNPNYIEAYCNLGNALQDEREYAEAVDCYNRALEINPNFAAAHFNLGNAYRTQGKTEQAIHCYQRTIDLAPDFADAYNGLGGIYREQGLLDPWFSNFQRVAVLQPNSADAQINVGATLIHMGKSPEAVEVLRRALRLTPFSPRGHSNLLFAMLFCPGCDEAAICSEHAHWNELYAKPLGDPNVSHANDRTLERRLRVGYVSPDFRNHVNTHYLIPLFQAHDQEQVEITCYSDVVKEDEVTRRIQWLSDRWRYIRVMNDQQVTDLVRADKIDILVDLTMHMENNRLFAFARKPAPVQVTWLAYPGTTGLTAIDYRLTDPYLDPGENDSREGIPRRYSEESVRLPDTFWCYDPLAKDIQANELPAITNGYVTFGNLNAFAKFNEVVLRLWARVLREVKRSRLILLAPEGSCRQWVANIMQAEGVETSRIEFVSRQPRRQYLEFYHQIDIGLDTVPYNGHTTSLDSLWMGVPVITFVGKTIVGRAGLSQLSNLGLPELVAHDEGRFVQIASGLAANLDRLQELRANLRKRMETSPLMDARRFARHLEAAYRQMWRTWCQQS
jgi:predicted O-linked N-acetylglucosamine transferase (SPINDLY family)